MKNLIKPCKRRKGMNSLIINSSLVLMILAIFPSVIKTKEAVQEKIESKDFRLYIAIPVLSISLAEFLFFSGKIAAAICVHIGILIALSLSNIIVRDPNVHKVYMPLMLLPLLRLVNFSTPAFFDNTLSTLIFIYSPLAIPVIAIIIHQRNSFEEIGITTKNLLLYIVLSIPLAFLLGLGEYLTLRPGYLIPDITLGNLLKLTFVMVFFVGLIEELIFRSILQTRLEKTLNTREAVVISSFLFGLMHSGHGTFSEILYTGFVGFIIGFLFYKTKSLPFVVILRGFANVFLFGILPHYLIGLTLF